MLIDKTAGRLGTDQKQSAYLTYNTSLRYTNLATKCNDTWDRSTQSNMHAVCVYISHLASMVSTV